MEGSATTEYKMIHVRIPKDLRDKGITINYHLNLANDEGRVISKNETWEKIIKEGIRVFEKKLNVQ
ncbi:MAG: hypothetical protein AAFX87_05370 [Bacteroidota bacterium]